MALDKTTVARIAHLARIRTTEEENAALAGELSNILSWVEQLNELDTDSVEPMSSVVAVRLPRRKDEVTDGGYADKIVANAPAEARDFFTVPKVLE